MTAKTSPLKTFVDTNILIYAHDVDAGEKHRLAKEVLQTLWLDRTGVLSPQVLQEFYVNVRRKTTKPLTKELARSAVNAYAIWCVDITAAEMATAFRIEDAAHISFWDALICAAALKSGAERILSEDLNAGQKIEGVRIENPFL